MRLLLFASCSLLLVWVSPTEAADEDAPPVTFRFHCRRNGCCDHHEWCRFWASVGECKTNGDWMVDNCQLACNTCKTSRRQPFTTSRPALPPVTAPHRRPSPNRRPLTTRATVRPTPPPFVTTRPTFARPTQTVPFTRSRVSVTVRPQFNSNSVVPEVVVDAKLRRVLHRKRPQFRKGFSHRLPPRLHPDSPGGSISDMTRHLFTTPQTAFFVTTTPFITTTTTIPTTTTTTTTTTPRPTTTTTTTTTSTTTPTTTTTTTPPPTTTTSTTTTTTTTTTPPPTTTTTSTTTTTTTPTTTSTTTQPSTVSVDRVETTVAVRMTPAATSAPFDAETAIAEEERLRTRFPNRQPFQTFAPQFRQTQPTTRRTTTTTTTTTTEAPTTARRTSFGGSANRCREIMNDPLVSAEEMIRERLVVASEDNSRRKSVDLDAVIRSNLANACVPRMDESDCDTNMCYNAYFRTFDGTCNNMEFPLRGASYRPYTRLLPTVYDNELSEPVGSLFPDLRPSPREITRTLTSSHASVVSDEYNAMVMQFGQFISHDMAKTTLVPSSKCNVCQNITSRCMSVPVTHEDTNEGFKKNTCIRVSRSSPICGSGRQKPRQQLNENTGYIDASPIYGSSVHDSQKFRMGNTGFLKLPMFNGMQMLPFDQSKCRNKQSCTVVFTAGDSRVNLFVGLSAWHTMFTKEHNRIASAFQRINPHWDGDRVFQESRKLVGAQLQAIVFREWLPKILGAAFASVVGDYHGYDPSVDSTIANEFTSAAFRFGHGMIQEFYQRLDQNFFNISNGALAFQKGTLHSDVLVNEGGVDPLIRGMFSQNVKRPQRVTTTVTENMFGSTDLSSINIQRGRDHGHPSYTKYRELCGMGVASSFDHLSREILNTGTREKLQRVYGDVDRVDLWVGALLEDPVIRGLVGPTVACIVGPQFKRTRDGDRFYYENPGVFTRRQLSEIRKSSLSRIICDNTQTITMVPREAFRVGHLTPCSQIPQMDLSQWREV